MGEDERKDFARVGEEPLVLDDLIRRVEDPRAGAVSTFSGVTRDHHNGEERSESERARGIRFNTFPVLLW